jgi:Spy/CpxP family protein refolding chaperone
MKKILALAVALGATAVMACPMGQGMMGSGNMCGGMMDKCQCDTKQLPRTFEALDLSDKQKEQIVKLREEGQAFHNKQREKMMSVLTAEQRGKLEYARKLKELRFEDKGPRMGGNTGMGGGMGCKQCPNK